MADEPTPAADAAPAPAGGSGTKAETPGARPPEGKGVTRFLRNLRSVAHFAKPRWRGLALAFALMSIEAVASAGRIFLFYPVMTRVVQVGGEDEDAKRAAGLIGTATRSVGGLIAAFDEFIDGMN